MQTPFLFNQTVFLPWDIPTKNLPSTGFRGSYLPSIGFILISNLHDSPVGLIITKIKVRESFFWPSLNKDVIRACSTCVSKASQDTKLEYLSSIVTMKKIHIDFVGKLRIEPKRATQCRTVLQIDLALSCQRSHYCQHHQGLDPEYFAELQFPRNHIQQIKTKFD